MIRRAAARTKRYVRATHRRAARCRQVEGLEFTILDSGCCERAGSFWSQACGERVLFLAVRGTAADDLVVAPGFNCRHQIADFCDIRRRLHTAELLAMASSGD
jgi:hypothetical protein